MKHIKTFEEINTLKYKVGDYILIDIKKLKEKYKKWASVYEFPEKQAKIIGANNSDKQPYIVPLGKTDDRNFFFLREDEIIRLLTPKEIKEYKLNIEIKKNVNKYNL